MRRRGRDPIRWLNRAQIGELISAKPEARRLILEEAAGISGLHSRRHEAELRLRAADSNLEKLDDTLTSLETQLRQPQKTSPGKPAAIRAFLGKFVKSKPWHCICAGNKRRIWSKKARAN